MGKMIDQFESKNFHTNLNIVNALNCSYSTMNED